MRTNPDEDPGVAVERATVLVGPALILTSVVLACGLAVTVFSSLPSLRLFGWLSAFAMLAALTADLYLAADGHVSAALLPPRLGMARARGRSPLSATLAQSDRYANIGVALCDTDCCHRGSAHRIRAETASSHSDDPSADAAGNFPDTSVASPRNRTAAPSTNIAVISSGSCRLRSAEFAESASGCVNRIGCLQRIRSAAPLSW